MTRHQLFMHEKESEQQTKPINLKNDEFQNFIQICVISDIFEAKQKCFKKHPNRNNYRQNRLSRF